MTDKIAKGGWLVSVTPHGTGDIPADFYEVAEAAPIAAEHAVLKHIDATDERIEAVQRMPREVLDGLGLRPSEVRKRA